MPRRPDGLIKAFGMSALQISTEMDAISIDLGFDLTNSPIDQQKRQVVGYDQFEIAVRKEAAVMSEYYEIFYCLEKSIRLLVSQTLEDANGSNWWLTEAVPLQVKTEVASRKKRDSDAGFTVRSEDEIDYTTFGELSSIITNKWESFEPILKSKAAVSSVLSRLNLLRGPIAHCCNMNDDEITRLKITVRDWFRLFS